MTADSSGRVRRCSSPASATDTATDTPRRAFATTRTLAPAWARLVARSCAVWGPDFRPRASSCSDLGSIRPEVPTLTPMSVQPGARGDDEDEVAVPGCRPGRTGALAEREACCRYHRPGKAMSLASPTGPPACGQAPPERPSGFPFALGSGIRYTTSARYGSFRPALPNGVWGNWQPSRFWFC